MFFAGARGQAGRIRFLRPHPHLHLPLGNVQGQEERQETGVEGAAEQSQQQNFSTRQEGAVRQVRPCHSINRITDNTSVDSSDKMSFLDRHLADRKPFVTHSFLL